MLNFNPDYIAISIKATKINTPYVNLTPMEEDRLKQITKKYRAKITIYRNNICISCCPYKFLYDTENNTRGVTFKEFNECLDKMNYIVNRICESLDIRLIDSIYNANLKRLDLTKNILTEELFHVYTPVLEELRPKQNLAFSKTKDIVEAHYSTLYFKSKPKTRGNNSLIIRIYDKNQELKSKKVKVDKAQLAKNLMRFEVSLNGLDIIKRKLKIKTVQNLLDKGFEYLDEKRQQILKDYLFYEHIDKDTPCLNSLDDLELARSIKKKERKNVLLKYMVVKNLIPLDYIYEKEILEEVGFKRASIERVFKNLKRTRRRYKGSHKVSNTMSCLYKELYNKLFKDDGDNNGGLKSA